MPNKKKKNKPLRPTNQNPKKEDQNIDSILRPTDWSEYIGQDKVKKNLRIILDAAKKREESIDHLLFYGQAGLGKTTLACLVAKETNANLKIISGPTLKKVGDLAAILSNLENNDVLFIDEAHRLNRMVEEVLYPAMESRKLNIVIGQGVSARTITLDLPPFTLLAATTRVNLLSSPLRSRFGAIFQLEYYNQDDIQQILKRSAKILEVNIDEGALEAIAKSSRRTPRVANRLLKRIRDYAEVNNVDVVNKETTLKTLEMLGVDDLGLESQDKRLLEVIIKQFNGGPVGLGTLAAALNEERGVIEEVYEPYLISLGFINRTSAGRVAGLPAYKHLDLKPKNGLV